MNNDIKVNRFTILWYLNSIKASHEDPKFATTIINLVKYIYDRESPLTVTRRNFLEYLGMSIYFSKKVKVKFTMYD